jgi:hypothetical protein
MTSAPPRLERDDLEEQLEAVYGADRKHLLVAFHGTGEPASIEIKLGTVTVVPVRSELELRERVPRGDEAAGRRVAFLVPFASQVPMDLQGLFARGGRVLTVGRWSRLVRLLGASTNESELDPDVLRCPLADHLLERWSGGARHEPPVSLHGRRLTVEGLWSVWLEAEWRVPTSGGLALDALLAWAATAPAIGDREPLPPELRAALLDHLAARLGPAGPVLWQAWEQGRGERVVKLALIFAGLDDAAGHADPAVGMWVREVLKRELPFAVERREGRDGVEAIARDLGRAAAGALRLIERDGAGTARARELLRAADEVADEPEVRAALSRSTLLPGAWRHRLDVLGHALRDGAGSPSPAAMEKALAALRALDGHALFKDPESTLVVERAEMAARLLAWLAVAPHGALPESASRHGDVATLGRWYAEEGGYVDWARGWARGTPEGALGAGVQAVVEAADRERTALDRRFARALASWVEAGKPADQVVPIEDAVERIALRFLQGCDSRRLLVLLLDGMAWTQAVELLGSLGSRAAPWAPLAWHASPDGKIGAGRYPVVLAGLPTVTEVSRAAFFAGSTMRRGERLGTERDPERWRAHRGAARLQPLGEVPRLLLRGEGHTAHGSASPEALSLVGDERLRIVAVVINAIDASLRGDTQERHQWVEKNIKSLPELLEKAHEAGRAVLLATDHGHVPGDRLETVTAPPGASSRWRPWTSPTEPLADWEVGLSGDGVWSPPGAHGVVLVGDDAHRYQGAAQAGAHGGATLAEVVAPCLLLGFDDRALAEDDRDLAVRPALVPEWWHFYARAKAVAPAPEEPRVSRRKRRSEPADDGRQLVLGDVVPAPEPVPVPEPVPAPVPAFAALERSAVLKARAPAPALRAQVAQAVAVLAARSGAAAEDAFAAAMGELPFRVRGLVSKLQEVLNVDGYPVLRHDREARQVYLDAEKLAEQFQLAVKP